MKHNSKELMRLVDRAQKEFGCKVNFTGNQIKIFPPNQNLAPYIAHRTERALHPVRRYLKNVCGFAI